MDLEKMVEEQKVEHKVHIDSPFVKKRISWTKVLIVIGVIAVLIAAFFLIRAFTGKTVGGTGDAVPSSFKIDYVLKLEDGTVIAENTSTCKIGKISSSLGLLSDKIDKAIENLSEGGKTTVELSPEEAFGEYNESFIAVINRTEQIKREQEINRTIDLPADSFSQYFSGDAELNKAYSLEGAPWNFTVTKIENDTVTVSQDAIEGQFVPGDETVYANVTKVTDDKITLLYSADEQEKDTDNGKLTVTLDDDYIYFKLTPEKGGTITMGFFPVLVKDFNDTSIILDYNGEYAGKKVIAELKMVEIIKTAAVKAAPSDSKFIEGAPTLQTFVMSYCPYGIQMEKSVLPAYKLLKNKANFEIRFVSYTMHGEKEETENKRQACIREEQSSKFWAYLECFLEDGNASRCIEEVGIDSAKLDTCMSTKAEDYLAVDKELNTKYGVQGSPTTILDETEAKITRTPEGVKSAVCNAFTDKPSECDEVLSSDSPTPKFGSGTAQQASSGGGCGA
jgi:FKBP-type peptidyl-prolyl cis-trans isomerase 2